MKSLKIVNQETAAGKKKGKREQFKGRAAVITLGCAKNHVDSEVMMGVLRSYGFLVVPDVTEADVAVVNTCGFLKSAAQESIDCILDVAKQKKEGRLKRLIVAGCMVERYREDIKKSLPEVDCFIAVNDVLKIGEAASTGDQVKLEEVLSDGGRSWFLYDETMPRQLGTLPHTAYVKVADGCDRPCAFCTIPSIRGPMRSRSLDSVLNEVENLSRGGVKEINLVAQDLTAWGMDNRQTGENLSALLKAIDSRNLISWQRLLYTFPVGITEELLKTMRGLNSVCEYLDIPLQHSSPAVLKNMKRPTGQYEPRKLVEFIYRHFPEIKIRTTFIAGFPGETESDVKDLEDFISEGHFTSLGVFEYSREEGTPSYGMPGQVPEKEKRQRRERLMLAQQKALEGKLSSFIGKEIPVIVDGFHEESDLLLSARARFQAPEVDGVVIVNDIEEGLPRVTAGQFCRAAITEVAGYDLVGKIVAVNS